MALADGPPEESLAAVTGRRSVVFSSRPVAADGARLVLIGHGRRVYLRRVDGLQIGLLAVHRHAVEVRFCDPNVPIVNAFTKRLGLEYEIIVVGRHGLHEWKIVYEHFQSNSRGWRRKNTTVMMKSTSKLTILA